MKIALVAATGSIGCPIAQEALRRGHQVTAILRADKPLPAELSGAHAAVAPIEDRAALVAAVAGHDVIASAFGPGSGHPHAIAEAARQLIAVARETGIRRLVVVGGAGNLEVAPGMLLMNVPQFPAAYKPYAIAHGEALAALREAADLDWTFFAPAAEIGPGEKRGTFRTGARAFIANAAGRSEISYADYADAFVTELEKPQFIKQVATVAY